MREKAMPVIGFSLLIPRPVRLFRIREDDARTLVFLVRIAPDIPVACARPTSAAFGALEPRMLVGCMVDDEFCDDAQVAPFRLGHEAAEITHRAEIWVDVSVVRYVVTVVAAGTGIEGQKPERGNAEVL